MAHNISSAVPEILIRYSEVAMDIDHTLQSASRHLHSQLAHFERRCTEPGFRTSVVHIADEVRYYAGNCEPADKWVGDVGRRFQMADRLNLMSHILFPRLRFYGDLLHNVWVARYKFLDLLYRHLFFHDIPEWLHLGLSTLTWINRTKDEFTNFDIPPGYWAALQTSMKSNWRFLEFVAEFNRRADLRENFKIIGRFLNQVSGEQGNVGMMDDLYYSLARQIPYRGTIDKVLKWKGFKFGFFVLDVALGSFQDWQEGTYSDDLLKTIGVNIGAAGINLGIAATGVGTIVLMVNSAIQLGGNLQVGVQQVAADWIATNAKMRDALLADAELVGDAVDRMDLGNITKEIAETYYDTKVNGLKAARDIGWVGVQAVQKIWQDPSLSSLAEATQSLNSVMLEKYADVKGLFPLYPGQEFLTPTGQQGSLDVLKATANVLDGVLDYTVAKSYSTSNQIAAVTAKAITSIPGMSDNTKNLVNAIANQQISMTQKVSNYLVDLFTI